MKGAIIGDIAGSIWEGSPSFARVSKLIRKGSRFTDDTVCTVAVADAILRDIPFADALRDWGNRYPEAGYGPMYKSWLAGTRETGYGSYGNGAPMRVSPCAWLARSARDAANLSDAATIPTHNHHRAMRAAAAVTAAIYLGRTRSGKSDTKDRMIAGISETIGEPIPSVEDIAEAGRFDVVADSTTLAAAACLREANSFEEAISHAIYCGGDTDTTAAIAGSLAEALFGVPDQIWTPAFALLPEDMKACVTAFDAAVARGGRSSSLREKLGFSQSQVFKPGAEPETPKRNAWGFLENNDA